MNTAVTIAPTESPAQLLCDVDTVGAMLNCSARHVRRLADAGRMPAPVKLGSLVRWNRTAIDEWIAGGCRPVRSLTAKGVDDDDAPRR